MLKLKDNVNPEQLKKYGYKQLGLPMFSDFFKNVDNNVFLSINERNAVIKKCKICAYKGQAKNWIQLGGNTFEAVELKEEYIQDLIDNNLVEKVEG